MVDVGTIGSQVDERQRASATDSLLAHPRKPRMVRAHRHPLISDHEVSHDKGDHTHNNRWHADFNSRRARPIPQISQHGLPWSSPRSLHWCSGASPTPIPLSEHLKKTASADCAHDLASKGQCRNLNTCRRCSCWLVQQPFILAQETASMLSFRRSPKRVCLPSSSMDAAWNDQTRSTKTRSQSIEKLRRLLVTGDFETTFMARD